MFNRKKFSEPGRNVLLVHPQETHQAKVSIKRASILNSLLKDFPKIAQVVNWLEISDRANFGAHSRTGIEFLGSNYNGILQSNLASNCTPISSELSKLVHSKTWHFTLTQPFPRDFWLPVNCSIFHKERENQETNGYRIRDNPMLLKFQFLRVGPWMT